MEPVTERQATVQDIHEQALLARHFAERHETEERRLIKTDRLFRIVAALSATGAFFATLLEVNGLDRASVGILLFAVAAVSSFWSAAGSWSERSVDHALLRNDWRALHSAWDALALQAEFLNPERIACRTQELTMKRDWLVSRQETYLKKLS